MKQRILAVLTALMIPAAGAVGLNPAEFSATAVQRMPHQAERLARMSVTPDKVRMEYTKDGQRIVEITDMTAGRTLRLMPDSQSYSVQQAKPQVMEQIRQSQRPATPCVGVPDAVCNKLGEETLFGRLSEKWEMVVEYQGRTFRSLYWIDKQRFMPLRQIWADGTVTELRPSGQEQLGNRATEKWQMVTRRTDGKTMESSQWFDPDLQIVIREELPGGYLRELRDIRVGPQDPALFQIPAGYRQVEAPAAAPAAR
jgi:hypothetical protein